METPTTQWVNALGTAALALVGIVACNATLSLFLGLTKGSTSPVVAIVGVAVLILFGQLHYVLVGLVSIDPRGQEAFNRASLAPNVIVLASFFSWASTSAAPHQVLAAIAEAYAPEYATATHALFSLVQLAAAGLWLAIYVRITTRIERASLRGLHDALERQVALEEEARLAKEKQAKPLAKAKRIWGLATTTNTATRPSNTVPLPGKGAGGC